MPVDAHEEGADLVRITLQGRMAPADQAALLFFITKAIDRTGKIRVLVVLDGFDGWTAGEEWGDAELRLESDAVIVKAAFVGDLRWKEQMFAFVARPFRTAPIEYFTTEAAARSWLNRA
jgi:hypothetical protein